MSRGWCRPRLVGMAHIDPKPVRGAGLLVRLVYWIARRRFGRVPTPLGIMAHSRRILTATGAFEMASGGTRAITPRLKVLAELKTATIIGCRFCIDIGSSIAAAHGITQDELRALPIHRDSPRFTALEKQVLDYAVAMTDAPMVVEKPLFDALVAALGVPGMVELSAAIAWENFRARFNHAFGAEEEGYSQQMACLLPPRAKEHPA